MSSLPIGWAECPLSTVCDQAVKVDPSLLADSPFTYIDIGGVEAGSGALVRIHQILGRDAPSRARQLVRTGDTLFSTVRTYQRKTTLVPSALDQAVASTGFAVLRPHALMCSSFLFHSVRSPDFVERVNAIQSGSNYPAVSEKQLRALSIRIPPAAEQARIVAAIEEAFSLLDAGETSLHATRSRLRRMRESVLTAAITGQLVPQDRSPALAPTATADSASGALPLPEGWTNASLGELFTVAIGTTPSRGDPTLWNGDIPWVSSGEVAFNRIKATKESITAKAVAGKPQRVLPAGTVMLAMIGEGKTRGQCAILDIPASHNQNCASIRVAGSNVSSEWVYWVLRERYARTRLDGSGNNQPALNKSLVEAIRMPVPPRVEQDRIVAEVERQFSFMEAAEQAVADNLKRSAALRRSVLQAAFEGRLVPQDPSDEPASVLLERIRAERAASEKSGARRGRRKVGG